MTWIKKKTEIKEFPIKRNVTLRMFGFLTNIEIDGKADTVVKPCNKKVWSRMIGRPRTLFAKPSLCSQAVTKKTLKQDSHLLIHLASIGY